MAADPDRHKLIAYIRVSTAMQGASGLGLEAQAAAIAGHVMQTGARLLATYQEVESGRRSDRPQLQLAIAHARRTSAGLVVARLDRLGRKARDLFAIRDGHVTVTALDLPGADRFVFGILALVAEREGETIAARTRLALAATKARGTRLGNPSGARVLAPYKGRFRARAVAQVKANAIARAEPFRAELEQIRASGSTSLHAIAREMNRRGNVTPRGCVWRPTTVARLLARLGLAGTGTT